jgi:hypothetical protein
MVLSYPKGLYNNKVGFILYFSWIYCGVFVFKFMEPNMQDEINQ